MFNYKTKVVYSESSVNFAWIIGDLCESTYGFTSKVEGSG